MKRRSLFMALAGLGVASLLPTDRALSAWPRVRRTLIQTSPLAGFQYHQGERLWPYFRTGDALSLVREPANPYDPQAVRIDWQGHKLGYVPRRENTAISQMLDRGERLSAAIERLSTGPSPWTRIRFSAWLEAWER
ncbi:MAG TPA: HIRAN domain-containing protein [Nitrococcus sp.]|nr:HIRAN domain-containing protein [Nitrococcus sp.]